MNTRHRFYCIDRDRVYHSRGTKAQVVQEFSNNKVVGPFRTLAGAEWFSNNPECTRIVDAERAVKADYAKAFPPSMAEIQADQKLEALGF